MNLRLAKVSTLAPADESEDPDTNCLEADLILDEAKDIVAAIEGPENVWRWRTILFAFVSILGFSIGHGEIKLNLCILDSIQWDRT